MLVYVPQRRTAAAARTWLLLIFLLPWPGLILYALFGRIRIPKERIEQQMLASQRIVQEQVHQMAHLACVPELPAYLAHLPGLAARLGDFGAFAGNAVELLTDYEEAISRLVADIDLASHHVHLQTYLLAPGAIGERVTSALSRAARRGVACRLMADAVGSRAGLAHWGESLKRDGVEVIAMLQVGFFRHRAARFDLRNHRKLAVIDSHLGYAGSQNLCDPDAVAGHLNEELVARITGPVVAQIQAVLLADCFMELGAPLVFAPLFPELPATGHSAAQLRPSGPGYQRENAAELFMAMLYAARERVVITTPYFVPDEPFLTALRSAARRGVEVLLIVSLHANQPFTQLAQRSFYDDLLTAGVQIHLYRRRFLHAKHFSVDDSIAVLGSSNIDIRSFALNAEVSLLIYDRAIVAELRTVQDRYLAESDPLDLATWRQRPFTHRVAQNVARLADSLL